MNDLFIEWSDLKRELSQLNSDDIRELSTKSKLELYIPILLRILGVVLFFISAFLIVAEMTIFLDINLSIFGIIINKATSFYSILITTIIPLIYLINTTKYSLFHLKLSGVYGVYKNRQTDSQSMLILTSFICRISFPLALNFIQILKLKKTTYIQKIMGSTDFLPVLGHKFTIFYPTILGVLCLFNYFNIFGSLLSWVGLSSFGFENEATNDTISEGNLIFERSKFIV